MDSKIPFFISIPHSGERIPPAATWLQGLDERIQMCDVDRFVDLLYRPVIEDLDIPSVVTPWHRYFCDLNRSPEDVDANSVEGAANEPSHRRGFIWQITTKGQKLLDQPISREVFQKIVTEHFEPFHEQVRSQYKSFFEKGFTQVYHLDAHSMPSVGTKEHRDPGERRADAVVSDFNGVSCSKHFKDLVVQSFTNAGLTIKENWPYVGGRITETYGKPKLGQNCIQVELNRALYMDEETKQLLPEKAKQLQLVVQKAVMQIHAAIATEPRRAGKPF